MGVAQMDSLTVDSRSVMERLIFGKKAGNMDERILSGTHDRPSAVDVGRWPR